MKIIYLHQYFNTPAMTGGTRSYEMARRFVDAGHEVHMITSWREPTKKSRWFKTVEDGINVHWLPLHYSNKMSFRERISAFFLFAFSASKKVVRLKGDIVFATSTPLTIALPAIYSARRLHVPMVFEVRDLWPELPIAVGAIKNPYIIKLAQWLERFAYKHSTYVVALSPGMKKGVVKAGYPPEKISVIPNSSDIDLFQVSESMGQSFLEQYQNLKGGSLIVYAGTLGLINGVSYLVEVAHFIKKIDKSIRFLIVGDGKEFEKVQQYAENMEVLNNNLWMIRALPKSEMPSLLSAATVSTSLVIDLPELWNNSANKFFDSLAAGKPLMINYSGWHADLLEKNNAGIVVPPDNAQIAAKMLYDFINNKERLQQAGKAALHLAKQEFDRDQLARNLLNVLEKAAQND